MAIGDMRHGLHRSSIGNVHMKVGCQKFYVTFGLLRRLWLSPGNYCTWSVCDTIGLMTKCHMVAAPEYGLTTVLSEV